MEDSRIVLYGIKVSLGETIMLRGILKSQSLLHPLIVAPPFLGLLFFLVPQPDVITFWQGDLVVKPYEVSQRSPFFHAAFLLFLPATLFAFRSRPKHLLAALISQTFFMILMFATIYQITGLENHSGTVGRATSLYFSVVTWTTLGYGDLQPNQFARVYAAAEAFLGYLYLGLIVGSTMGIVSQNSQDVSANINGKK